MSDEEEDSSKISRETLRILLLHEYRLGISARDSVERINRSMGPGTVSESTAMRWFKRFRNGTGQAGSQVEVVKDAPRSGRPNVVDNRTLRALLKKNPHETASALAKGLNCSKSTFLRAVHAIGKQWKRDSWVERDKTKKVIRVAFPQKE